MYLPSLAAALTLAATTLFLPAAAEESPATWGIVPSSADGPDGRSTFDYKLDPGATLSDWVAVFNHSTAELHLNVYPQDAYTTTTGAFGVHAADVEPTGVGSWITMDRTTVTVPPRSRVDLPFRLAVPERATPGDHAGGLVASLAPATTDEDQVRVEHRVGARDDRAARRRADRAARPAARDRAGRPGRRSG